MTPILVPRSTWYGTGAPVNNDGVTARPKLARPVEGGIAIHYTGSPIRARNSTDDATTYMRWLQDLAFRSKKSFEYNFIIPPRADGSSQVWEYAGDYMAAHAGSTNNPRYVAVQFALGVDNHPSYSSYDPNRPTLWQPCTDAMVEAFRWLRDTILVPSGLVARGAPMVEDNDLPGRATACPGDGVRARWSDLLEPYVAPSPPPAPPPTVEVPAMILVRNAEPHTFTDGKTYPAGNIVWELVHGELRHVGPDEYAAISSLPIVGAYTNAQLAKLPRYSRTITGKITGTVQAS
jgi:hypothetical protein